MPEPARLLFTIEFVISSALSCEPLVVCYWDDWTFLIDLCPHTHVAAWRRVTATHTAEKVASHAGAVVSHTTSKCEEACDRARYDGARNHQLQEGKQSIADGFRPFLSTAGEGIEALRLIPRNDWSRQGSEQICNRSKKTGERKSYQQSKSKEWN